MKNVIAILAVLSLAAFAGQIAINPGPNQGAQGTDGDLMQYDDGSAHWIMSGGGNYKGVWFNVEDFTPGALGAGLDFVEFWFYHHENQPWDTSDIYIEVWNGDVMGPTAQLDQNMVVALDYSPVFTTFATPLEVEANFWLVANTELSSEGVPSTLGDVGTAAGIPHSFSSADYIIWEPMVIDDLQINYFYRADADYFIQALDNTTWGSIKAIF